MEAKLFLWLLLKARLDLALGFGARCSVGAGLHASSALKIFADLDHHPASHNTSPDASLSGLRLNLTRSIILSRRML